MTAGQGEAFSVDVNDGVAWIALGRPPVNALAAETFNAMDTALAGLTERPDLSCLVIGSAIEGVFSAGADLKEAAVREANPDESARRGWVARREAAVRRLFADLVDFPLPTIAVVDGPAVGAGCTLTAACDLRVGSGRADFRIPELHVNRCGGARHLLRVLPQAVVRQMYFSGAPLTAEEGHRLGFVNVLAEIGELDGAVRMLIAQICEHASPGALRRGKTSLNEGEELPLDSGYRIEQHHTVRLSQEVRRSAMVAERLDNL